jgi:hypothetical protein
MRPTVVHLLRVHHSRVAREDIIMKTETTENILATLCERRIPFGLESYGGDTINVWLGESGDRKAQTNLASNNMEMVAIWLEENAVALFPQAFAARSTRRRG